MQTRTDFNGKTTTYTYNSMNQLLSKTPDPSFQAPAVTYTYNLHGQAGGPENVRTFLYDSPRTLRVNFRLNRKPK